MTRYISGIQHRIQQPASQQYRSCAASISLLVACCACGAFDGIFTACCVYCNCLVAVVFKHMYNTLNGSTCNQHCICALLSQAHQQSVDLFCPPQAWCCCCCSFLLSPSSSETAAIMHTVLLRNICTHLLVFDPVLLLFPLLDCRGLYKALATKLRGHDCFATDMYMLIVSTLYNFDYTDLTYLQHCVTTWLAYFSSCTGMNATLQQVQIACVYISVAMCTS